MSVNLRLLIRPAIFTAGVCGTCFCCAAIVQHERRRTENPIKRWRQIGIREWTHRQQQVKTSWDDWRRTITRYADRFSTDEKITGSFILFNLGVFLAWRSPRLAKVMDKYFTSKISPDKIALSPMILSCFSHRTPLHFLVNMCCIYSFSQTATNLLGPEQLIGLFLSAGVFSSLTSIAQRLVIKSSAASMGASGAFLGVMSYICIVRPDLNLLLFFVPITAGNAIKLVLLFDLVGLIAKWRHLDHAAHLGGTLFGIWYANYGQDLFNRHRGAIAREWYKIKKGSD